MLVFLHSKISLVWWGGGGELVVYTLGNILPSDGEHLGGKCKKRSKKKNVKEKDEEAKQKLN
jgi:hypothetical protein